MKADGKDEIQMYIFLAFAVDGGKRLASHPSRFTPGGRPLRVGLNNRTSGKKKNPS
jgi:hypothetical protein